jgi:hypothetical protein
MKNSKTTKKKWE